jgi:hypothetical protein
MRKFLALLAVVLLVSSTGTAFAYVNTHVPNVSVAPRTGWLDNDIPARVQGAAKADTIGWGYYELLGGVPYAVLGGEWTFDHGAADPLEGWTSKDLTSTPVAYWRAWTAATWPVTNNIPYPHTSGMAICGTTLEEANLLLWVSGLGCGNDWSQTLTSPTMTYDGSGDVNLVLDYFAQSEATFDFTKIFLEVPAWSTYSRIYKQLNGVGISAGWDETSATVGPTGVLAMATWPYLITASDLGLAGDPRPFRIVVEFKSDGLLSDEDGRSGWDSFYGPSGLDNVAFSNNLSSGNVAYDFNDGTLQGWVADKAAGTGVFMGLGNMGDDYTIDDPCVCVLEDNVLEFHNEIQQHTTEQYECAESPIIDRSAYLTYNRVMVEFDQYADMPQANGVFMRIGWRYYPYENPYVPGMIMWSGRVGVDFWSRFSSTECQSWRSIGTNNGLPQGAEKIKLLYEIQASCEKFGLTGTNCSGFSNFTPIIDNLSVRCTGYVAAPPVAYAVGCNFQDGFGLSRLGVLSPTDPGNSDVTYDLRRGTTDPSKLADSLAIVGAVPANSTERWEAKLWFRLRREGPGQTSASNPGLARFNQWKAAVGSDVNYPNFAWGYMDSVEAPGAKRNEFCSQFRELAPAGGLAPELRFNWGGGTGDQGEGNEMLPDSCFTPGTKIEYFVTTNFTLTPSAYFFLPDTAGGVYNEYEILPSYRGVEQKFPCVLYVDAGRGARPYIQRSLNMVLNGAGQPTDPIPDLTTWDRYDYTDASSNWNGPLNRMPPLPGSLIPGNSGASIPQLLGYKLILVSLADEIQGTMEPRDWDGFDQWLKAIPCDGNVNLQGLIVDGSNAPEILDADAPGVLNATLGAALACPVYNENGCLAGESDNDQNNCVRVEAVAGAKFTAGIATDLFGNWCPERQLINVLSATQGGFGNKKFVKRDTGYETSFAQVVNDKIGPEYNYRSVIESFSYHRITARGTPGVGECVYALAADDLTARVTAAYSEIAAAINWTLNITDPATEIGLCQNPCTNLTDVPDEEGAGGLVTRLYQNRPNPFNPRTAIKFSLAADGPTKLIIYDVNGRRIRTLVDKGLKAGTHEVVWDGSDDAGHTVTSGVYWSQLHAGGLSSNKKMVVLK